MRISQLTLTNFRNYRSMELELPKGLLVFSGDNAQGKSNLLEAMYLLSIAKAYRAASDREAIGRSNPDERGHAQVLGVAHRGQDRLRIMVDMRLEGSASEGGQPNLRKEIRVNGIPRPASELVGAVNTVLFDAEDIHLVSGAPALRRRYLDILICQLDRVYLRALQRYQRVVYQRNHLLRLVRERRAQSTELEFWSEALVKEGTLLTLRRHQVVRELRTLVTELHDRLTGGTEELAMEYVPSIPVEDGDEDALRRSFQNALEEGMKREVSLGATQWGPHRDDLSLTLDGLEAATYASRGQSRTLALVLKLAEGTLLERERGESPIILLDDVLSELDGPRSRRLLEHVCQSEQVLLSTTDMEGGLQGYRDVSTSFLVESGAVRPL